MESASGASEDEVHPLERINGISEQSPLSASPAASFYFHDVLVIFSNANDQTVLEKELLLFVLSFK